MHPATALPGFRILFIPFRRDYLIQRKKCNEAVHTTLIRRVIMVGIVIILL